MAPSPSAAPEISAWIERRRIMSLLGDTAGARGWRPRGRMDARGAVGRRALEPPALGDLPAVVLAGGALLVVAFYLVATLLVSRRVGAPEARDAWPGRS